MVNRMVNDLATADEAVGAAMSALADPTRREVVRMLAREPLPAGRISAAFPISKPAMSKHLRVLRDAGLVEDQRHPEDRRIRVYRLRPEPVDAVAGAVDEIRRFWQRRLAAFKEYAEQEERSR
jgi:DNA-binding transcriptional ArsR family regulator